jgi:transposase
MQTQIFEQALDLQAPWYIQNIEFSSERKQLDIYIDFKKGSSFLYEEKGAFKAFDTVKKSWRHLNFFEHECYLHARVPIVKPQDGQKRRIKTPWEGVNSGFTLLFEALIMELCTHMPVQTTADMINVDDEKIWRILHKYVERAREDVDLSKTTRIGLDETSKAKGHKYVTCFVDMDAKKTVHVAEGKDNKTVVDFVKDLEKHHGKAENITDISSDMSPAFIKGVKENLPNAEITFDRFHLMQFITKAVDRVRKDEVKENPLLKNTKYLWLKNYVNLTCSEIQKITELKKQKYKLKTVRAMQMKEAFQDIYLALTKEEFQLGFKHWISWAKRSRLEPMKKAAKSIQKHWDGVMKWFDTRLSNGFLEGMNTKIQAAKRKAYGYRSFRSYSTIIYMLTAKLDFSKINPCIK